MPRKPLVALISSKTYCVEVTVNDLKRILELDNRVEYRVQLHKLLEANGAYQVEYDGHFGPFIWYTLDEQPKLDEMQAKILTCISEFIAQKMPPK